MVIATFPSPSFFQPHRFALLTDTRASVNKKLRQLVMAPALRCLPRRHPYAQIGVCSSIEEELRGIHIPS